MNTNNAMRRKSEWKPKGQRRARVSAEVQLKVTPYVPSQCKRHPSRVAGVMAGKPMQACCDECFTEIVPPAINGPGKGTTSDYDKIVDRAERAMRRLKNNGGESDEQ